MVGYEGFQLGLIAFFKTVVRNNFRPNLFAKQKYFIEGLGMNE